MLKYKHSILCGNDDKLVGRREILKVLLQNWWTDVLCLFWSLVQHTGTGWRSHRAINRVVVIWLWSSKVKWPKRTEPHPSIIWILKTEDWLKFVTPSHMPICDDIHKLHILLLMICCNLGLTVSSSHWLAGWQIHLDIDVHLDGLPPYCRLRQLRKVI